MEVFNRVKSDQSIHFPLARYRKTERIRNQEICIEYRTPCLVTKKEKAVYC